MQAGTQHHLYRFQVPVTAPAVVAEKHAQEPLYFSGDLLARSPLSFLSAESLLLPPRVRLKATKKKPLNFALLYRTLIAGSRFVPRARVV